MHEHLAKHRLDRASIKGIGRGRVATPRSFGIETLANVTRPAVLAVPGFGPALTQSLMAFRASIERVFVFDPQQPVSPIKIGKIDQEFRSRQAKLTAMLRAGPADLAAAARQCAADRERLEVDIERARLARRRIARMQ
jgi:DNA-binding helix-hairpin-helix protein with protein kinase domain